ncbi:MAG: hypothetical protein M0R80_19975 [Proteobacteria bacterium]|nr:hypothetical protein [Pseudomonadota bacterium]
MRIAKTLVLLLAAWLGLAAAFTGCTCVVNHYHYGTARPSAMYVAGAPPAAKDETRTASPSEGWVWIKGHYEWSESEEEWIWVGGVWVEPPDEGATWVDAEYEDNNGDWMYVPGYWEWNDPGSAEAEEEAPRIPPGDLHWVGGGDIEKPGEGTEPAVPRVPPGSIKIGTSKSELPVVGPKLVQPEGEGAPPAVVGPTLPPKGAEPPQVAEPPGVVTDDPYDEEDDDGAGSKKKIKKPGLKEVKPNKPELPPEEEHAAVKASGGKPSAAPADPYGEEEEAQPSKKHGKKNKAKPEPEPKDDGSAKKDKAPKKIDESKTKYDEPIEIKKPKTKKTQP